MRDKEIVFSFKETYCTFALLIALASRKSLKTSLLARDETSEIYKPYKHKRLTNCCAERSLLDERALMVITELMTLEPTTQRQQEPDDN